MFRIKSFSLGRDIVLMTITILLFLLSNALQVCGGYFLTINSVDLLILAMIMLNASVIAFVFDNPRRHIAFLVYLFSFNTLLLGRVYTSWLLHNDQMLRILEAESYENLYLAVNIVYISFFISYIAYRFSKVFFAKREQALNENSSNELRRGKYVPIIRTISIITFLICAGPLFYTMYLTIGSVMKEGYMNSFTTESVSVNPIISRLAGLFSPAFAVFLATLPDKKQLRLPLIIFCVYIGLSMLTGRRNILTREILVLLIYFVLRDDFLEKAKRIFKKGRVLFAFILSFFGLYALEAYGRYRADVSISDLSFFDGVAGFFDSQGASFRVIIQTVNNITHFDPSVTPHYLFFPIEHFFKYNIFASSIFGVTPESAVQTAEYAAHTMNYGHVITYLVNPQRYLSGGGFGTSFVAEAYVAYGIFGVVLVSIMVGFLFRFISSVFTRSWWMTAVTLMMLNFLVYIPRDFAFGWVFHTLNITNVFFLIGVYFAAVIVVKVGTHVKKTEVKQIG